MWDYLTKAEKIDNIYRDFYQLDYPPFNVTSNPELLFESSSHNRALATLIYGIQQRKGIILMTGEVGTGKTTLCKALLDKLPAPIKTSLILNPYFSSIQLFRAIVDDFGIKSQARNKLSIINKLNSFCMDINKAGGKAVLIIDEAQDLSRRQLEQVRLLSNLETSYHKLLQIILVGQPELSEKIEKDNLRQIRQRIFVKCHLNPFSKQEVTEYIRFKLDRTGGNNINFNPETIDLIYQFSGGIPRLVNMLCERIMLIGFIKNRKSFDRNLCQAAIEDLS